MTSMRASILALLDAWDAGSVTDEAVRDQAEVLLESESEESLDAHPDIQEALVQLSLMHHQLITKDDIPAVRALIGEESSTASRIAAWRGYSDAIDLVARAGSLREVQLYEPGVDGVLRHR